MLEAYLRDRVVMGPTLVVPVRVLWRDYLAYCDRWGFEHETATLFVAVLCAHGAGIRTGGSGRLRRCFTGVGINAGCTEGKIEAA